MQKIKNFRFFIVLAAVFSIALISGCKPHQKASPEKYHPQLMFEKGEIFTYRLNHIHRGELVKDYSDPAEKDKTIPQNFDENSKIKIFGLDDGSGKIKWVYENYQEKSKSMLDDLSKPVILNRQGVAGDMSRNSGSFFFTVMFSLPPHPVKKGEEWKQDFKNNEMGYKGSIQSAISGVKISGDESFLEIESTFHFEDASQGGSYSFSGNRKALYSINKQKFIDVELDYGINMFLYFIDYVLSGKQKGRLNLVLDDASETGGNEGKKDQN
ncbi:MAG: hypothetical protein ACLFQV_13555 [Vulcanimicrobiota bacterium]